MTVERLAGQRVVVTEPESESLTLVDLLKTVGAEVLTYPVLEVRRSGGEDLPRAQAAVRRLAAGAFGGLVITSSRTVSYLLPLLRETGKGLAALEFPIFAADALAANALVEGGVAPILSPHASDEAVVESVRQRFGAELPGTALLVAGARASHQRIVEALGESGAHAEGISIYDILVLNVGPPLPEDQAFHWVTFSDPQQVEAFAKRTAMPEGARTACLESAAAEAVTALGLTADIVAFEPTVEALVTAMIDATD